MNGVNWYPLSFDAPLEHSFAWGSLYSRSDLGLLSSTDAAVYAIGAFDGLHLGHRALVSHALAEAHHLGVPCVVITFDPDPSEVLASATHGQRLLSTQDRRAGLLGLGVDHVASFSFTSELAALAPHDFVSLVAQEVARPLSFHVGSNFRFGKRGEGDVDTLRDLGSAYGFTVHGHALVEDDGSSVSATRIRTLLEHGELDAANMLLCRCHYVRGIVQHGRGEGASFGFPTANVACDPRDCMPAEGVYACYVTCGGKAWPAAANVGAPPTFSERRASFLEANLIGFSGNLYNENVSVSFVKWLRASRPFDSLEELEKTVLGNIDWVRRHVGDHELEVER